MKIINTFTIDTSDLPQSSSVRRFTITGDVGSEASLQVINSSQQFYNFSSKSFTSTFNSQNNLSVRINGDTYNNSILFPTNGSGDSYTILLIAPPDKDTQLEIGGGKHSYSTVITQNANATLTFTIATANTNNYTSWSSDNNITSIGSPGVTTSITKTLDWTLTNASSDTYGFGLRLIRQPIDTDWYFTTTETVNGAVSSSTEIIVDDLTDLATGMYITGISGGSSLSGTPTIIAIDISLKKLTLSSAQTFVDNTVLTFQARGSSIIQKAIGANIDFSNFVSTNDTAVAAELTKTVRTTATGGNDIPLIGTYGISGGGFVTVSGVGIKNTGTNTIQSVDPGENDGSITTQEAQATKAGSKIYFTGSTQSVDIDNTFTIKSHPSANKTIYLNLDNFITPGVSGS